MFHVSGAFTEGMIRGKFLVNLIRIAINLTGILVIMGFWLNWPETYVTLNHNET